MAPATAKQPFDNSLLLSVVQRPHQCINFSILQIQEQEASSKSTVKLEWVNRALPRPTQFTTSYLFLNVDYPAGASSKLKTMHFFYGIEPLFKVFQLCN